MGDQDRYSVVVVRIETRWFSRRSFYLPRKDGRAFRDEYPTVWGFDTEAEAWGACDQHERETYEPEPYDGPSRGDGEDFHADIGR